MATSTEKFRKLLAAYENDVLRKQHRMGKRVYPVDEVRPLPSTGYCSFIRGQQAIWTPAYEVIGTFVFLSPEQSAPRSMAEVASQSGARSDGAGFVGASNWRWSWADPEIEPQLRTRVDEVRTQGQAWGIDELTTGSLLLLDEQQAWELAIVAVALSRAEALYRHQRPTSVCYLALFDGPPLRRSPSMRIPRESTISSADKSPSSFPTALYNTPTGSTSTYSMPPLPLTPGAAVTPSVSRSVPPSPVSRSVPPSMASASQSLPPPSTASRSIPPSSAGPRSASNRLTTMRSVTAAPVTTRSVVPSSVPGARSPEPSLETRRELGLRMAECVPYAFRGQRRSVILHGRVRPPVGPIGAISFELQLVLKAADQGADLSLQTSPALLDSLSALWTRCREGGTPFRGIYARLEPVLERLSDPVVSEGALTDTMTPPSRDAWSTLVVLEA